MTSKIKPRDPGYLLQELDYAEETEAAASLNIKPQTLAGYRKAGVGPAYTELARRIFYSRDARAEWLRNGGTRAADEALKGKPSTFYGTEPEPDPPTPSPPKPAHRATKAAGQ